ncbi:unnamed protein product [Effrenium voratum]|uniref:DNA mismatch repair proteins mutS family domain-containing protein n=1 Tax=Effrenium voratum TaxID=2562239 RepID=A0AA36IID9_9DINO|nr:unnamed protein product [Effrenium voratum]CAJ1421214.1 unnamed protein product [Effrenium voratum]
MSGLLGRLHLARANHVVRPGSRDRDTPRRPGGMAGVHQAAVAALGLRMAARHMAKAQVRLLRNYSESKQIEILSAEAMDALRPAPPGAFRKALLEGFGREVQSFSPEVHQGDRRRLLQRLRRCRLGEDLASLGLEAEEARKITQAYVQSLWTLAARRGLAVDAKGSKMRSAAADLARAFLSEEACPHPVADGETVERWRLVGSWLSERAMEREPDMLFKAEDFHEAVAPFWREQLERVNRPEALRLVRHLGGDNLFGWLKSMASSKPTGLFQQALAWKSQQPHTVLLVQVGDFFEAWGVDAVMLVQWCGLNPMARRARAGFPVNAASLQQTVDCLTRADLSVAVYVQSAEKKTVRVLRQVLTPGAPSYLHGHELGKETIGEFSEGRPYIAMRLRTDGLLFAEIRPFRREVRFREDVTPEAVEALLADQDGVAWPIFVDGSKRSFLQANKWKWFPKQRRWMNLPPEVQDDYFLQRCCQELCHTLQLSQDPPFVQVRLNTAGALQPLTLSTSKNLGVLQRDGVPLLVDHALPEAAPASTRRLMRRWLLAPRSQDTVYAMRELLQVFISSQALVLPPLHRVPPVAKVIAFITARTGSERLFRDIQDCCQGLQMILAKERYGSLWDPLLKIVAADTGSELHRDDFLRDLRQVLDLIQDRLHDSASADDPLADCSVSKDADTQRAVERLFESNEAFRGIASRAQESVAAAYKGVQDARDHLCQALKEGLPAKHSDALVYNPFDNDLCFKQKPRNDSHAAHDRKGKAKKDRFTTKKLEAALSAYLSAAKRAELAVQQSLEQLCDELSGHVSALRGTVAAAELLMTAHAHASHASRLGWCLPELNGTKLQATIAPYWMDPGDAVWSHVDLDLCGAIATGPNMSGKSTLMRAIGASALLANCGFLCPVKPGATVPQYQQVVFISAEGDRPSEGVSAFGREAMISASLLRRAGQGTLALVDEFGSGTEPRAAKAAVCALLEELSAQSTQFVVATHLHDIVDVDLRLDGKAQPIAWRMGMKKTGGFPVWTYALELGVCRDSLAAHTLEHFGWPARALGRFQALLAPNAAQSEVETKDPSGSPNAPEPEPEPAKEPELSEASSVDSVEAVTEMMAALKDESDVLLLQPQDMLPAPLCAGKAVLYALLLSGRLYIGQSDNMQQRLRQHRQRFGERLEGLLLLPVANTGEARRLETRLQRQLLLRGFALESSQDALHRNFSDEAAAEAEDEAMRLRRIAEELLEMAHRR